MGLRDPYDAGVKSAERLESLERWESQSAGATVQQDDWKNKHRSQERQDAKCRKVTFVR